MMDIRVYDFDFNLLSIMNDVISSSWCLKYNGIGTYEGHFKLGERTSDILLENKYIILTEGENQAVCTGKIADSELLICGRTLNWLLSKRVMPPFKTGELFGGEYRTPAELIEYVIGCTFISPPEIDENGEWTKNTVDEKRRVDNFNILPMPECEKMNRHFWRNSANTAEDIIADLAELIGAGHRLYFNFREKRWDFEILSGSRRDLVISEKNRNFYDVSYTEEIDEYASGGWYEDSNDDGESVWRYIAGESSDTGMRAWETVLSAAGLSEAEGAMAKKRAEQTVSGTMSRIKYGEDYSMGDTVAVSVSFGGFEKTIQYKIEGMNIWNNENGRGEEPIFKRL